MQIIAFLKKPSNSSFVHIVSGSEFPQPEQNFVI